MRLTDSAHSCVWLVSWERDVTKKSRMSCTRFIYDIIYYMSYLSRDTIHITCFTGLQHRLRTNHVVARARNYVRCLRLAIRRGCSCVLRIARTRSSCIRRNFVVVVVQPVITRRARIPGTRKRDRSAGLGFGFRTPVRRLAHFLVLLLARRLHSL